MLFGVTALFPMDRVFPWWPFRHKFENQIQCFDRFHINQCEFSETKVLRIILLSGTCLIFYKECLELELYKWVKTSLEKLDYHDVGVLDSNKFISKNDICLTPKVKVNSTK